MAEAPEITPELQEKIRTLQGLAQQLQMVAQQRSQMELMQSENRRAKEALEASAEDAPVYRNVGSLMVRDDRAEALERLTDEEDTLEIRVKRMRDQETQMQEQLQDLEKELQAALQ